jgi:hypothetical protein
LCRFAIEVGDGQLESVAQAAGELSADVSKTDESNVYGASP